MTGSSRARVHPVMLCAVAVVVLVACGEQSSLVRDVQPTDAVLVGEGDVLQDNAGGVQRGFVYGTNREFAPIFAEYVAALGQRGYASTPFVEGFLVNEEDHHCFHVMPWRAVGNPELSAAELAGAGQYKTTYWVSYDATCYGD